MSEIGERIKKLRKERNLSQDDLAKAVGVHQTMISAIECGNKYPSVPLLVELQNHLGANLLVISTDQVAA